MAYNGCGLCGQHSWRLYRYIDGRGAICGTCCNRENEISRILGREVVLYSLEG